MLVFAGGSNVLNFNLPSGTAGFSEQVADSLKLKLVKLATVGASNSFLLRSIRDYLQTNTPALLIVTWQSWEREEWEYEGQYYQINASGSDVLPDALQSRYKEWVTNYNPDNNKYVGDRLHENIWQLHQELVDRKIPHVFYNEMYPFSYPAEQQKDWGPSFIGPYDNDSSFYWYLKKQGVEADQWYHFGKDGHSIWGNFLIQYINQCLKKY